SRLRRALVRLRHRLEQLPGDRAVRLDEGPELPGGQAIAAKLGIGSDRCSARALVQQRYFAEVVARAEAAAFLSPDGHGRLTVLDHEEPDASLALGRHRVARIENA